jgi:hypothetical protein
MLHEFFVNALIVVLDFLSVLYRIFFTVQVPVGGSEDLQVFHTYVNDKVFQSGSPFGLADFSSEGHLQFVLLIRLLNEIIKIFVSEGLDQFESKNFNVLWLSFVNTTQHLQTVLTNRFESSNDGGASFLRNS